MAEKVGELGRKQPVCVCVGEVVILTSPDLFPPSHMFPRTIRSRKTRETQTKPF